MPDVYDDVYGDLYGEAGTTETVAVAGLLPELTAAAAIVTVGTPIGLTASADLPSLAVAADLALVLAVAEAAPSSPRTTYSLVVVARIPALAAPSFVEIGVLNGWSGLAWEEALNAECQATVTVDPHGQTPAVRSRLGDLVDATELWVYRGSDLVFSGPVIGVQPQAAETSIVSTLHVRSLWHYPRRWPIEPDDTLTFTADDQFQIVRDLIGYWQALDYGHFGLSVTAGDSGITRDRTYVGAENHNIGQRIEELAALSDDGFDFRIVPATRLIELGFPQLGTDKTGIVILDRRNIVDPGAVFSVGADDLMSESFAVSPQDDPAPPLTSHAVNVDVRQRWGRVGSFTAVNDVSVQATLDGHASRIADDHDQMFYQPGPELIPVAGADVDDFTVGDRIEMVYDYGFGEFVAQRRVTRRRITVSETGDEAISVEFAMGKQTNVKTLRDLARRVAELEART